MNKNWIVSQETRDHLAYLKAEAEKKSEKPPNSHVNPLFAGILNTWAPKAGDAR